MEKVKYSNKDVRRQDRLLEEQKAIELLQNGEFGVLSMIETIDDKDAGFAIPLNYVYDGDHSIYFHCAKEGYKLDCLSKNPNVSFCVVGHTHIISNQFTTNYESIIIRGKIDLELTESERKIALMLILDKYSPNDKEIGITYTEKSFLRTNVIRLDIETMSGKNRKFL
jgi:nitroimidazol reductase NimA-like FMN-containing flavoprotein (pyridoxamine 5'-phosphate oxidase superfamily)